MVETIYTAVRYVAVYDDTDAYGVAAYRSRAEADNHVKRCTDWYHQAWGPQGYDPSIIINTPSQDDPEAVTFLSRRGTELYWGVLEAPLIELDK